MAISNNLSSNTTAKLMKIFAKSFEASRVMTKTVDTQMISGSDIDASTGGTVSVKRPHDYFSIRTAGGDISSSTKSNIQSGKATAQVQNWITVAMEFSSHEEALNLDQLEAIIKPAATRAVTDLETSLAGFMMKNCNLHTGDPNTVVDAWSDVANAGALLQATGVPMDTDCYYVMSPFIMSTLAGVQHGLSPGTGPLVNTAWQEAKTSTKVGGMTVYSANTLATVASGAMADKAGTVSSTVPSATYALNKDTMLQTIVVDELTNNAVIKAGETVEITGRQRLNAATKDIATNAAGSGIKWAGTVTADATVDASGHATIIVAGSAIFDTSGNAAYNTVDSAIAEDDVITILNTASTTITPNLFYKRDAFGLATIKLPKLYNTDTTYVSSDGISIRCSKYSDGDTSQQKVRFDIVPAFTCYNPLFAGHGYGS